MIYTIRVTAGQEKILSEILMKKAKTEKLGVYSIANLENVKGYLFIEAAEEATMIKLIQKVKHVKGFLRSPISVAEIQNLIQTAHTPTVIIENGDIVEMTSGPFKGEKAKVLKLDEAKEEITVELVEVAVPIPVTIKMKMVKLFKKAGEADEENS